MNALQAEKRALRQSVSVRRDALPAAYIRSSGEKIAALLTASPLYQAAKSIFAYISTQAEPDTRAIIETAWEQGKKVFVPLCHGKGRMEAVPIKSWGDVRPGMMGILEPISGTPTEAPVSFDLVLVPCVAAAKDGRRLGHGGGYYDRFLEEHKSPTVCLCFEKLLLNDIPTEPWDMVMDGVLTEAGWSKEL